MINSGIPGNKLFLPGSWYRKHVHGPSLGLLTSALGKITSPVALRTWFRSGMVFSWAVFILFLVPVLQELILITADPGKKVNSEYTETSGYPSHARSLRQEQLQKERRLAQMSPSSAYLVVNTAQNHFYLYRNRKLYREGLCSTGSYILLQSHDEQRWIFKTPRGMFRVEGKTTFPVWRKPDWAFIEEGLPVPPPGHHSRFEAGVLGEYALSIGNGYLIHGTLYKRLLGMPVTHGCIRMNDEDLEAVYLTLSHGSKVYIY